MKAFNPDGAARILTPDTARTPDNQADMTGSDFLDEQYFGENVGKRERRNVEVERNPIHDQYFSVGKERLGWMEPDEPAEDLPHFPDVSWKRPPSSQQHSFGMCKGDSDPLLSSQDSVESDEPSGWRRGERQRSRDPRTIRLTKKESTAKARPAVVAKVVRTVSGKASKAALDPDSGILDDLGEDEESGMERPSSAFDALKNIRKEERDKQLAQISKMDSDGSLVSLFRLWSLIPDISNISKFEVLEILKNRILYQEHDIIFLNKPYGMVSQDGKGVGRSLASLLPDLAKLLFPRDWTSKKLYLAQRLDKETTGAIMIPTNFERKEEIAALMSQNKIVKKYLCITKGVPKPDHGLIRIPLGQRIVGGRYKMVPVPEDSKVDRRFFAKDNRRRESAETEYRVISQGHRCALVECTMKSGVTHQVRSHLGFGLDCPIIGDHKYSDFLSFKPQRVPGEVLQKMGIRASKARDMPMYLHAREVLIPEYLDGRNLFFRAPIPKFFLYTMKKLRLKI